MLKKLTKVFCIMFLLLISAGMFNGCCGKLSINMSVEFEGVDSELDFVSYKKEMKLGDTVELGLTIPEGFDHEDLVVQLNNSQVIPWEVTYSDPDIEEEYRYTVSKKITFSLSKVTKDFTINIDMSGVKKRALELVVSDAVLNITKDSKSSNLSVISINPDNLNRLSTLDSSNILARRYFDDNKATVYYNEYIILCYSKPDDNAEISTLYTDVNHFTKSSDILTKDNLKYCKYDVATRGALHYNVLEDGISNTSTRLYYIGRIQEDFNLYNKIPDYVAPKGFVLDNDENKFSLLTNISDYNSDMLSINVFAPTDTTYDASNSSIDKVDDIVLQSIDSVDTFKKRYSRYDMYIGDDLDNDELLTAEEKESLPSELYVSISSELDIDNLHIHLLHSEKQSSTDSHITFSDLLISEKKNYFIKIDLSTISDYIDSKTDEISGTPYITGNAILYVEVDQDYITDSRNNGTFEYTVINYPIQYNGKNRGIDYGYSFQFYILNDDGTKDYGLLDMQKWTEDLVYFRTDKLYDENNVYKNNVYINITGLNYNSYYSEVIEKIYVKKKNNNILPNSGYVNVDNPSVFNGYNDLQVDLSQYEYTKQDQFTPIIYLIVSEKNEGTYSVNLSNLEFNNSYDAIYMTNNINFTYASDFKRITDLTKTLNNDISFGTGVEIYYFVVADTPIDFNLFIDTNDEEHKLTTTKKLVDIIGNSVKVSLNGREYDVYVKYQAYDIYETVAYTYQAYN